MAVVGGEDTGHLHQRGGGEEGMVFRVTRHTPRHVHGGQRRLLTPEGSFHSAGKRMKLDDTPFPAAVDGKGQPLVYNP